MAVKDEYAFGFLDAGDEYDERELERALLSKIEDFLREVGGAYTFMGSQYRLEVGDQEFFIDILLYHRKLKSLVAIELKIGPFIPEFEYLQKCSPLNYLDAIKVPLLLVHGKNDHVVAEKQSEQIYRSMKASNKKVTYILFPDEGHRLAKFANEMMYLDHTERFLSQHLGGDYRPVDSSILSSSSAQVSN